MEKEKNSKKFIIKFIIFSIILIIITIIGICVKINEINREIQPVEENEKTEEVSLKETDEEKYTIKAYNETYDQNSIEIVNYYDVNGKVQISDEDIPEADLNFIQIKGLKNQSIQNAINEKLKQKAYNVKSSAKYKIVSRVRGNFGNILSVLIDNDEYVGKGDFETLNIDLTTGKDIQLEKVFISSAPINAILARGVYKAIVWNEAAKEGFVGNHDANNYDTSQYEDIFLKLIRKYNENKDDIKFVIYPSGIEIYGMLDETILGEEAQGTSNRIQIDFLDNLEEVAIYKRYLADEDIYQNNNLREKDVIVLTEGVTTASYGEDLSKWRHRLNYGKLQDNIFIEEAVDSIEVENTKVAMDYIKTISNKEQQKLKQEINSDHGAFFQKYYSINEEENYYCISIDTSKAICTKEYFDNLAFRDYIVLKNLPSAQPFSETFAWNESRFPNFQMSETTEEVYIDKQGNYIGATEAEAKSKTGQVSNEEIEPESEEDQDLYEEETEMLPEEDETEIYNVTDVQPKDVDNETEEKNVTETQNDTNISREN